jgi:4-hydroxythreonine-4-phosphate dehydrogenase
MPPRVAITLGAPRGIGPEVVSKTLADPPAEAEYVVIGPDELVAELPADRRIGIGTLGKATVEGAGRLTADAVLKAVELALSGAVDAIVTAPAEKRALHAAGYEYPGHTEWLAELAGGVDVVMMLVAGSLRVALVTTHIPLAEVPLAVTIERVLRAGQITRSALECWWGIEDARLAVCALNPHGGEGGLFGDEDDEVLAPAARELDATGPLPADTVFVRALRGEFDAVLTPYHDVGMTAVKVAGFGGGVNVTLGLPFIRTAPDHGTGFDIAGQGIAEAGSMREAVRLAAELGVLRRGGV